MDVSAKGASDQRLFVLPDDRLYLATRAWILWIQGLFSTRPVGDYKWSSNPSETEILVTGSFPTDTQKTVKKPFIVVQRGPAQYLGTSHDGILHQNMSGTQITFADIIATSITISCVAREGPEAQRIAYTLFRLIPVFRRSIQRLGRIHAIPHNITIGQEAGYSSIVPENGFPEWRIVQVGAAFQIQDVVSAETDFHTVLRAVNLHMGLKD